MEATLNAKNYLHEKIKNTSSSYRAQLTDGTIIIKHATTNAQAHISVERALGSGLQKSAKLSDKQVGQCAVLHTPTFSSENEAQKLLPLICYFGLRQARIWQCRHIISTTSSDNTTQHAVQSLLHLTPLAQTSSIQAQQLNYAIHNAYENCDDEQRAFIKSYFAQEILDTFQSWLTHLFQGSWFSAINTHQLSKEQYVSTLFNLHAFVKWTTRLAARCVAVCDVRELRNHYINHLKGEINHEVIIESDLKALHADVDYLIQAYVPHPSTAGFMVLQESITAFKQDAVLMLACPFVAEGMTANISSAFVNHLYANIKSWGVKSPESVSRFLTSHMKTDGGDDGHWIRVILMMDKYITSEHQLQLFLNSLQLAMTTYAQGLNANIDDMALWQPASKNTAETTSTISV